MIAPDRMCAGCVYGRNPDATDYENNSIGRVEGQRILHPDGSTRTTLRLGDFHFCHRAPFSSDPPICRGFLDRNPIGGAVRDQCRPEPGLADRLDRAYEDRPGS